MKKIFFALSGLILLAFFILVTVNAQGTDSKASKEKTEISIQDKACCNTAGKIISNCCGGQTISCDASKCKEGKCDPATCKTYECNSACSGKCGQSSCMSDCTKKSTGIAAPMNCAKDLPIAAR